ncbi:MAG: hypothetical protein L0I76_28920, partial [Pseudonocardia sp.]|nr:hypothetical protein [Pseudonocardia sp.]
APDMAYIDPLAALLSSSDGGSAESLLVRATITSWNTVTGANTVSANGVVYTDLPFLGSLSDLGAGTALLILSSGAPPVILGLIRFPPI